ncbi:MAG: hypothetical protein PHN42_00505 [Bacilli bacterium]|nr:hypothetical protein [Bacilli bacterium]
MFEKYYLNDLYIGHIKVLKPNLNDLIKEELITFRYWTILKKTSNDKFIDLKNPKILLSMDTNSNSPYHLIEYMEPLSNYHINNNKLSKVLNRYEAIKEASNCYEKALQKKLTINKVRAN